MQTSTIKKHLIKSQGHRCQSCSLSFWLDQPIPLEIHHLDGNTSSNDLKNLQILCPNCHAQTPNFTSKNRKRHTANHVSDDIILKIIPQCQSVTEVLKVLKMNQFGRNHARINRMMDTNKVALIPRQRSELEAEHSLKLRRVVRPSPEELKKLLWEKPASQVAKDLGVSDSAIIKWCRFYGIPKPPRGYWRKVETGASGGGCNHTV